MLIDGRAAGRDEPWGAWVGEEGAQHPQPACVSPGPSWARNRPDRVKGNLSCLQNLAGCSHGEEAPFSLILLGLTLIFAQQ